MPPTSFLMIPAVRWTLAILVLLINGAFVCFTIASQYNLIPFWTTYSLPVAIAVYIFITALMIAIANVIVGE